MGGSGDGTALCDSEEVALPGVVRHGVEEALERQADPGAWRSDPERVFLGVQSAPSPSVTEESRYHAFAFVMM